MGEEERHGGIGRYLPRKLGRPATNLRIGLHAHILMVLLLTVYQASALLGLRDEVKAAVCRLLDASILFSRLELSRTIEDSS